MQRERMPLTNADFCRLESAIARAKHYCFQLMNPQDDLMAQAAMLLVSTTLEKAHQDLSPQRAGMRSISCRGPLAVDIIARGKRGKFVLLVGAGAHDVLLIVMLANSRYSNAGMDEHTLRLLRRINEAAKGLE